MNKKLILGSLLAAVALSGCSYPHQEKLTPERLQQHPYELVSIDGAPIASQSSRRPTLEFSEKMHVSGAMCNRFMGQGQLDNDRLFVRQIASTRMLCADSQLNVGDRLIAEMLQNGAKVSLHGKQLILREGEHELVYRAK
ncbi:META domain-containing protein [Rouxiella badensis]|uniref:META domain-containing protein n=1 Tax=Rouxiella badensis TaxID=1646377 RepID=UPI0013EF3D03|nr:META domain-containing protein [Rouxiella badensis]QII39042.1 META domain-containing protein [Rouxiella badensis]